MIDKAYCMSSYMAFRYVAKKDIYWKEDCKPEFPKISSNNQKPVTTAKEILDFLRSYIAENLDSHTGIFLSGGIDSAILASLLPKGTKAYTIRFIADGAIDESKAASVYAKEYNLDHRIIDVLWNDYQKYENTLISNKKAPLHAVEVALYKTALAAKKDGIKKIVLGNGADSTFGGMDKLLSKDWTFDEFVQRYNFIMPEEALVNPKSILAIYEKYRVDKDINYISFLKEVHGIGIIQAFDNAIECAGCTSLEPFEYLCFSKPLDLQRIRQGEPKYILNEIFKQQFPKLEPPRKIPFARPMDQWLKNWEGPKRKEFITGCTQKMTGDQKYLTYCLEKFLDLVNI